MHLNVWKQNILVNLELEVIKVHVEVLTGHLVSVIGTRSCDIHIDIHSPQSTYLFMVAEKLQDVLNTAGGNYFLLVIL